jgi:hypothetical protein
MKRFDKFKNWLFKKDTDGTTRHDVIAAMVASISLVALIGSLVTWLS